MSALESRRKLTDLEAKARVAETKIGENNGSRDQLEAIISAAELYMKALRLADNPDDKKRLDSKTKQLISKAETLKGQTDIVATREPRHQTQQNAVDPISKRKLTTRENIILLESSKLNDTKFRPWVAAPSNDEFELEDGQEPFIDEFGYSLSETQLKHFNGWRRAKDALSSIRIERDGQILPNEATMLKQGTWDLVQDVAPDCSVVASFCVGTARAEKGHKRLFGKILYPYDYELDRPKESPNGRYVLRLYFNGCWRRVDVDDRLPSSNSSRVLHVIDRSHPGLIWPTIAEKAYMKVRGGYDFPGSNSGTDLAVLCGWIPQQVFLHDEDIDPTVLWERVLPAFLAGNIMCTLGTGKLGRREQKELGLGAEHDYAVLDMKEKNEIREMLIKNPWADGDVWKGATRCRPNPGHEEETPVSPMSERELEEMLPGTFWIDFNHVFQYFEHMYINWNPSLFGFREDMHFSWHLPEVSPAGNLFTDNPQFSLQPKKAGEVWVLLNRHFRTGDFSAQNHGKNGYISLYLFNKNGNRVFSSENAIMRGPFVDSPNTLLRFHAQAGEIYTIVVVGQDLPVGKHNFTISAFSNFQVELNTATQVFQEPWSILSAWTRSTAGGSSDSPTYLQNPQFILQTGAEGSTALVLKALINTSTSTPSTDLHVKAIIVSSNGKRITKLRQRDVLAHSGHYARGSAVIETVLAKGVYTVICSTFEQNQLSKFQLDFYSTLGQNQILFKQLPAEGSGRLSILAEKAAFADGTTKLIAPITTTRVTKALFKASLISGSTSSLAKMCIEQGPGPYRQCIACSSGNDEAEFSNIASGLRIEDLDLNAAMTSKQNGGLWLVLEKPVQGSSETKDVNVIQVEALCEERIEIGRWVPLDD